MQYTQQDAGARGTASAEHKASRGGWPLQGILLSVIGVLIAGQLWFVNQRVVELAGRVTELAATRESPPVVKAGSKLAVPEAKPLGSATLSFDSERTLVLFLSPRCSACTASMPRFIEIQKRLQGVARLSVISFAEPADLRRYLEEKGFTVDAYTVAPIWLQKAGFLMTPTMALVGPGGTVLRVWIGSPAEKTTNEIVEATLAGSRG